MPKPNSSRKKKRLKPRVAASASVPATRAKFLTPFPQQGGKATNVMLVRPPTSVDVCMRNMGGISDIHGLTLSYVAGTVCVGNGTVGIADQCSFYPGANITTVTGNSYASNLAPVAPANGTVSQISAGVAWGRSYIEDIWKHFARKRYHSIRVRYVPSGTGSNTINGITIAAAPYRGSAAVYSVSNTNGGSLSEESILSMKGSLQCPSYEPFEIDLTPYIAGGSGSKQNEFFVDTYNIGSYPTSGSSGAIVPACFVFGGRSVTAAVRGFPVGKILVTMVVDLLDFTGNLFSSFSGLDEKTPLSSPAVPDVKGMAATAASGTSDVKNTSCSSPTNSLAGDYIKPVLSHEPPSTGWFGQRSAPIPVPDKTRLPEKKQK